MPTQPFYSIIIPTYNSEITISRALESVLQQTFSDYEILIMDGLSTDRTKIIVKQYQSTNKNIHFYSEEDKGIYDAMNKGINTSNASWLYFMGSDDYLFDADVLKKIYHYVNEGVHEVIYGNVNSTYYKGLYDGNFDYKKLTQKNICHQAIFIKKSVFNAIGTFDISYKVLADWHHNIRWFYNSRIKHRYVDLTIAEYTAGGISYYNQDYKFKSLRNELFLKYGFFKIPIDTRIVLLSKIVRKYKKQKNIIKFLMFGLLLFFFKFKRGVVNFEIYSIK